MFIMAIHTVAIDHLYCCCFRYAAQLLLNLAWSPLFFKKHEIGFALLDITGEDIYHSVGKALLAAFSLLQMAVFHHLCFVAHLAGLLYAFMVAGVAGIPAFE